MPYDHGLSVCPVDAGVLRDTLYDAVARAVTPWARRQRTVDIVAYPARRLEYERSITLLVLVSTEDRPQPDHFNREELLANLEAAEIRAHVSTSRDSIWGQLGDVRFWIIIHKVPHSRGFDDILAPRETEFENDDFELPLYR